MAISYSTPGMYFTETDASILPNTTVANGVGAIVINANQGYVNQRILSTSPKKFHEQFGDQETADNYGHFAADQYLATSPNLYAVRATMGDEQYSFIQYPYDDASLSDCVIDELQQTFEYVDNEGNTQIKLLKPLKENVEYDSIKNEAWETFDTDATSIEPSAYNNTAFALVDTGYEIYSNDLQFDQDDAVHIFRDDGGIFSSVTSAAQDGILDSIKGKYYKILSKEGLVSKLFLNATGTGSTDAASATVFDSIEEYTAATTLNPDLLSKPTVTLTHSASGEEANAYDYKFDIPQLLLMNELSTGISFNVTTSATLESDTITSVLNNAGQTSTDVAKIQIFDWQDEAYSNPMIVELDDLKNAKQVKGVQYREITGALTTQVLYTTSAANTVDSLYVEDVPFEQLSDADKTYYSKVAENGLVVENTTDIDFTRLKLLAYNKYGKDANELCSKDYKVLYVLNAMTNTIEANIIFGTALSNDTSECYRDSAYIFNTYWDNDKGVDGKREIKAAYISLKPKPIYKPWQYSETSDKVKKLVAFSSSEIMNDPSGLYRDGYSKTILTQDEPGNGDIERYDSIQNNQLVIAAVAPGEFGNDIGVSVITPEVADVPALQSDNAFNWKYLYDDEDVVDKDYMLRPSYKDNPNNLTWKKIYRINVYVKSKSQQASVWGSGLDALIKQPAESFLVSNDPTVKDGQGNSMYAPYVINGNSKYIYVSLSSVINSKTVAGTYAMPHQTYSIYQLTGGKNSKLNNIKEKTAALELYRDKNAVRFDIIFNVEPIETFQSRQKYAAMQYRIADIASSRGMDISFIQVTSKVARTGYKALSEAKLFTFNNGSYVSCACGYDQYYDPYTSNWVYLPKSVAQACAEARCLIQGKPWQAPAGVTYGAIPYTAGQLLKLNDYEIGQLYDAHINFSRTCAGYGELLLGNKTALKKSSALNRINVRVLVNDIEKQLETLLFPYLYQNNTPTTRNSMRTTVDTLLSSIMSQNGLVAKSVSVRPDSKNTHLVHVEIKIVPPESIEFIDVNITLNRQTNTIEITDTL